MYTNEATGGEASRLSFAGEYLGGDASLLISDLLLTDSGEYYCKVKTGGKYHWSQVNLIVLGECCVITHVHAAYMPSGYEETQTHLCIYTHTYTHCLTHRPNHWIISLAHFLRHADWSNDSIWFRQCDLISLMLFGFVWIGLLMRWDQKHTTGTGRAYDWLIMLGSELHGQASS